MGLDIYVGSLTRYYSGNWETIIQTMSREAGTEFQMVYANQSDPSEDVVTDPAEIRSGVIAWRDSLSAGLAANLAEPLDWDESEAAPYFTDKPAWIGYASLLLWAAYSEHAEMTPPTALTYDWCSDQAYQKSADPGFTSAYPSLLTNVETWLPAPFMFNFTGTDLTGRETLFGSAYSLRDELHHLNQITWKADDATISKWRRCEDEPETLEAMAKCSYAMFWELTKAAIQHRLVMKLDY
jgi:hypothetical protein